MGRHKLHYNNIINIVAHLIGGTYKYVQQKELTWAGINDIIMISLLHIADKDRTQYEVMHTQAQDTRVKMVS